MAPFIEQATRGAVEGNAAETAAGGCGCGG
jgi:hypothetical protein